MMTTRTKATTGSAIATVLRACLLSGFVVSVLVAGSVQAQERSVFDPRTWFSSSEEDDAQEEAGLDSAAFDGVMLRQAINLASSQRMLGQRMVGAYCLAGVSELEWPGQVYDESIEVFESQVDTLKDMSLDDSARAQLARVETVWYRLKGLAGRDHDIESASAMVEMSYELMDETEFLVAMLVEELDEEVGEWISVAGRQRMLGQRIASLTVCEAFGVDGLRVGLNVSRGLTELKGGQDQLHDGDFTPRETRRAVNEASNYLAELEYLLGQDEIEPMNVFETTDYYLRSMNRVAGMIAESRES